MEALLNINDGIKVEIKNLMRYLGTDVIKFPIYGDGATSEKCVNDYLNVNLSKEERAYWDRGFILEKDSSVFYTGYYYGVIDKIWDKKEIKPTITLLKDFVHRLRLKARTKAMAAAIKRIAMQELKFNGIAIPDDEMYVPFVIYKE